MARKARGVFGKTCSNVAQLKEFLEEVPEKAKIFDAYENRIYLEYDPSTKLIEVRESEEDDTESEEEGDED